MSDVRPLFGRAAILNTGATPQIQPISTTGRQEAVIKNLSSFIEKAGLVPGQQLPSERELMAGLGVGRSTIREAVSHLNALGAIEVRKGSGTFLKRAIGSETVYLPLSITSQRDALLQTLEVRRGLETEASALTALRATPIQISFIEAKLDEMERVHYKEGSAGAADLAFHMSIYEACGNPLFGQLLSQMREAFTSFWEQPFDRSDFAKRSFPFHRELFKAIAARDPDAARMKTLAILAIVEEDIIEMSNGK